MSGRADPPLYKGEPLDSERGPGLGCFWIQVGLLAVFLVLTPLTVVWAWDPFVSGVLLVITLGLLFFAGQTIIFLLRLVAADRRSRRRPLDPAARRTVGQMEDDGAAAPSDAPPTSATGDASPVAETAGEPPASDDEVDDGARRDHDEGG